MSLQANEFAAIRPASTFVEVSGLIDSEWLVETEADCILENDGWNQ